MKTTPIQQTERGNVLIVTLLATGIIGFALASYLMMISTQHRSTVQSHLWNSSIPIVEAGIEEALAHLNKNCVDAPELGLNMNITADGWEDLGGNVIRKTRELDRDTSFIVAVDLSDTNSPIVFSQGFMPRLVTSISPAPYALLGVVGSGQEVISRLIEATSGDSTRDSGGSSGGSSQGSTVSGGVSLLSRRVSVNTTNDPLFAKGMVAKDMIDLKGNRVRSDSFDSDDGPYNRTNHKDNGDVATNGQLLNIGNAEVYGRVSTGPGGTVMIGYNGSVGDKAWVDGGNRGIQEGRATDDMNVSFPDVILPFSGGGQGLPSGGTYVKTIYEGQVYTTLTNEPPATNYYTGTLTTNTATVIDSNLPPSGSYVGNIVTNYTTYVTTNTAVVTTTSYPAPGTYSGAITTNAGSSTTTGYYPAPGTYIGSVITNTTTRKGGKHPEPGTYTTITTNWGWITSTAYPAAGSYEGSVSTNIVATNTVSYPSSSTLISAVSTNTEARTTTSFPSAGTYIGSVRTNTSTATTTGFPGSGTYIGTVTTNTTRTTTTTHPATGTYVGQVTTNWAGVNIKDYSYDRIAGYTYTKIDNYSYTAITGYSYSMIAGYTYYGITNYEWTRIDSYTYTPIASYTYNSITGYNTTTAPSSYSYQTIQSYTYTNAVQRLETNTYDHIFTAGDYKISSLSGKILITGDVRIHVTDNVQITGQGEIAIARDSSLKLYVEASSATISGNGVVNETGRAENFYYFGLPTNTDLKLSGNAAFTGVIYAPNADFHLGGGGKDVKDFTGASITASVQMNGHFNFHYDERLSRVGPSRGYVITSWHER